MIKRKRKQILYNTEGKDFNIQDFNIKTVVKNQHIEPIQPFTPEPNPVSDTNTRPGGIDPFYRHIDTNKKTTQNKSETNKKTTEINERPGDIDPFYRYIDNNKKTTQNKNTNEINKRPGDIDPYYSYVNKNTNKSKETNPFIKAMSEPNISDAEGLRRAYASDSNIYIFKGILYVAGTKGGVFGSDMRENVRYIGVPNIESAIVSNVTQLAKTATTVLFPGEQLAANIGFGIDMAAERYSMKDEMKDLTPAIESLSRFKDAEQAYLANKDYIQRVVGDSSGGAVIEALKSKYPEIIGGNGYGSPIVDVFGRSKIKGFLQNEREARNAAYSDKWFNKPEKIVNNVYQDVVETALGLEGIKTTKDTGIEQHRTAFDPVASLNNSATTTFSSISDVLSKNTLTHSYELTASNISTSKDSTALADGYITKDGTPVMFQ